MSLGSRDQRGNQGFFWWGGVGTSPARAPGVVRAERLRRVAARLAAVPLLVTMGCAPPVLTRDGQLVFTESEQRGAAVLTASGVEVVDRAHRPTRAIRRSASEPWRAPLGFLLPRSGVMTETSKPVAIAGRGIVVVARASDAFVPSWGGELLVRLDTVVPARAFSGRAPRSAVSVVVVLDATSETAADVVHALLDHLGREDRVALVGPDGSALVPRVPGTHRTLLEGALDRALDQARAARAPRRLARALDVALAQGDPERGRSLVVVVSDGHGVATDRGAVARAARALRAVSARVVAVGAADGVDRAALDALGEEVHVARGDEEREDAVRDLVAPPGNIALTNVELTVASAPAPARVLEASGGELEMTLYDDRIELGDLYAGEARTEILRVAIPDFVPGEEYELMLTARYTDALTGRRFRSSATVGLRYSDDVEVLANRRHGDVIAYASALAMVRRLERAFAGSAVDRVGGLRELVAWQAASLAALARRDRDPSLALQAEVLGTLLGWVDED